MHDESDIAILLDKFLISRKEWGVALAITSLLLFGL